jgi:hypothetical protein
MVPDALAVSELDPLPDPQAASAMLIAAPRHTARTLDSTGSLITHSMYQSASNPSIESDATCGISGGTDVSESRQTMPPVALCGHISPGKNSEIFVHASHLHTASLFCDRR